MSEADTNTTNTVSIRVSVFGNLGTKRQIRQPRKAAANHGFRSTMALGHYIAQGRGHMHNGILRK
jgi:hypothetical protein